MRKSMLLLLACIAYRVAFAQYTQSDSSHIALFDSYTSALDKSQIPTGILYDRVVPFANLPQFNPDHPLDTSDYSHWKQAYYELYLSTYANSSLLTLEQISAQAEAAVASGTIPIGILNYSYSSIDTGAVHKNLLQVVNGKLNDVNGRSESPYDVKNTLVASALSGTVEVGEVKFVFTNQFYLSNRNLTVDYIVVDFGDGSGASVLYFGDQKTVHYSASGTKNISYMLQFTNGSSVQGNSTLTVSSSAGPEPCNITAETITASVGFQGYEGSGESSPSFGKGWVSYYYHDCSDPVLRKPIIIMDGIDAKGETKARNIYKYLNYFDGKLQKNAGDDLRAEGYDLVILDFVKGADFIERNAFVLVKLIQEINAAKVNPDEKLIVIGPSMGAMVSRYALAYMEEKYHETGDPVWDHQTGLYVSFDGPQQGANLPIGDQHFLEFFATNDNNVAAKEALSQINAPAAQQLLVHHYREGTANPAGTAYRWRWENSLEENGLKKSDGYPYSYGYPMNLRKIALINGSQDAMEQYRMKEPKNLIELNLYGLAHGEAFYAPNTPGNYKIVFQGYDTHTNRANECVVSPQTPNMGSYDIAPGGIFNLQEKMGYDDNGKKRDGFTVNYKYHCFMPSISTLDIKFNSDAQKSLFYNIRGANIVCNKLTPFDAYYAPHFNEQHISFTPESFAWLYTEINNANRTTSADRDLNGITFNYGVKTKTYLDRGITISNGGILSIQDNAHTGYGNEPIPSRTANSTFTVETHTACNSPKVVVDNNGLLAIGDPQAFNTGVLRIGQDWELQLKSGGKLTINNNSKLEILAGAKFTVEQGAMIELNGENAVLEIDGQLYIGNNATFTFTGNGLVRFHDSYPPKTNIFAGANSTFSLQGTDIDDEVLEVTGGEGILPQDQLALFSIKNGTVKLSDGSRINAGCPLTLSSVKFTPTPDNERSNDSNGFRGLHIYGQPSVTIDNCIFEHGYSGIFAPLYNLGSPFSISNTEFNDCSYGIYAQGAGVNLNNIYAHDCKYGFYGVGSTMLNTFTQSDFENNELGIEFFGSKGSRLYLDNCFVHESQLVGTDVDHGKLITHCSNFTNNDLINNEFPAIWLSNKATYTSRGSVYPAGGNTVFARNHNAIGGALVASDQSANALQINNGGNDFSNMAIGSYPLLFFATIGKSSVQLYAKNNMWRVPKTTMDPNIIRDRDYVLYNTSTTSSNQVTLYYQPTTENIACGSVGQFEMKLPDLKKVEGTTALLQDPYDFCPQCPVLLTADFVGVALDSAIRYCNRIQEGNLTYETRKTVVDKFNEILESPLVSQALSDPNINYLYDIAYTQYLEAFSALVQFTPLAQYASLDNSFAALIRLIDNRIARGQLEHDQSEVFYSMMDKAQLYRMLRKMEEAIVTLNTAAALATGEDQIAYSNEWQCMLLNENKILSGQISRESQSSLNEVCTSYMPIRNHEKNIAHRASISEGTKNYANAYFNGVFSLEVIPNIINTNSLPIRLNLPGDGLLTLSLSDVIGRTWNLYHQQSLAGGNYPLSFDVSGLPNGIYFLKASYGNESRVERFVLRR